MPEWMIKEEDYVPDKDRDGFIGKSILSILGILSRIKSQGSGNAGRYIVDANLKVVFTLVLVLLVSLAKSSSFVVVVNVYLLVVLSLQDAGTIVRVLRVSLIMAVFTFVMLLPAMVWGRGSNAAMLTGKVFATVTSSKPPFTDHKVERHNRRTQIPARPRHLHTRAGYYNQVYSPSRRILSQHALCAQAEVGWKGQGQVSIDLRDRRKHVRKIQGDG